MRSRRGPPCPVPAAWLALAALLLAAPQGRAADGPRAFAPSASGEREWTAERMRRARPLPLPTPSRSPGAGGPAPAAAPPPAYAYPPPYSRWQHHTDAYDRLPYRTVGKLFFSRGGSDFVCTATSVGNAAILTAGHCVHAGADGAAGWSSDLLFVPAYRDGQAPYGRWRASRLLAAEQWYAQGAFAHDLGGAVLRPRNGLTISQAVGSVAPLFNADPRQHWLSLSYPAAYPFGGGRMIVCAGSWAYGDDAFVADPVPVGMGCDVTGGASGGPWIVNFRHGSRVNGVVSYRYARPEEIFSPYFGVEAERLWQALVADGP